jgi:hypothetical protein
MSLFTVKLDDIRPIECGEYTVRYGFIKGVPRYKPFLLQQDSFLMGKHEVCLTNKELFGGSWVSGQMLVKGREKFIREVLGPLIDPWRREEFLKQVIEARDESEITLSLVREEFDEVKFSNITELKFRRLSFWSGRKTIDVTFQGGSISFIVCAFTLWGVITRFDETKKVFKSIQKGVNTYRLSNSRQG